MTTPSGRAKVTPWQNSATASVATVSHQATVLPRSKPMLRAPMPTAVRSAATGSASPISIGRNASTASASGFMNPKKYPSDAAERRARITAGAARPNPIVARTIGADLSRAVPVVISSPPCHLPRVSDFVCRLKNVAGKRPRYQMTFRNGNSSVPAAKSHVVKSRPAALQLRCRLATACFAPGRHAAPLRVPAQAGGPGELCV